MFKAIKDFVVAFRSQPAVSVHPSNSPKTARHLHCREYSHHGKQISPPSQGRYSYSPRSPPLTALLPIHLTSSGLGFGVSCFGLGI